MIDHKTGTREEWLPAREELLKREKEHTRLGDEIAQQRRYHRGCWWRRTTASTRTKRRSRSPSCSMGDPSCSCTTSCSALVTRPVAPSSSIADSIDGVVPHLQARDATMVLVSQAPLEKLQGYKRRMSWTIPWVSSSGGDFNFDLGFSQTLEQSREAVAQIELPDQELDGAYPPIVASNARASGTDIAGYLTESPGFSAFVRDGDDVYHTYSTTWRGLDFVMTYYPILDHAPVGRDEGKDDWQLWIRRHDEYGNE